MNFEKKVFKIVRKVFFMTPNRKYDETREAYLENGTLFLRADEYVARRVFSELCREFDFKVQPSKVGDEFAYDFVA
jgi:hypothetical protein